MKQDKYGYYHLTGCLHMHTPDSDGTKPHEEVAEIASEAGLDYLIFTDHMTLKSREKQERFHGDVLVIVGYEHNDPADKNHYLLLDSPAVYNPKFSAREYVAAGFEDGALGIIAHPDEVRSEHGTYPPYEWNDWSVEGYTGIELWNQMSEWMERLAEAGIIGKLALLFSPRKFMKAPPAASLRRWDEVNQKRPVVGVAGVDAHGFPYRLGPKTLTIFPYKVHFRSLQTHVVLKEPLDETYDTARAQLLAGLREANVYFSNRRWGDASGFQFMAHSSGQTVISGQRLILKEEARFEISVPRLAEIRLIRNGEQCASQTALHAVFPITRPGLYRAEARRGGKGWIFSNHIRIESGNQAM
ncbi:MAG: histidinol-phosphatase [candidate division Zixibacteria bacterium]|nr:histidinol-phosphatase [candidate division Zixibacteria bacterium]